MISTLSQTVIRIHGTNQQKQNFVFLFWDFLAQLRQFGISQITQNHINLLFNSSFSFYICQL